MEFFLTVLQRDDDGLFFGLEMTSMPFIYVFSSLAMS